MGGTLLQVFSCLAISGCGCNEGIAGDRDADHDGVDTTGDIDCGDCNDGDPCTEDSCNLSSGTCEHEPLDSDGDGHAAMVAPDGTVCGGDDCDDTDDTVHPGAPEVCMDGIDQDCDGSADGPTMMPPDLLVSDDVGFYTYPYLTMAWTGSEFGIAWKTSTYDTVGFARVGVDGSRIGDEIELDIGQRPAVAWTGSLYTVLTRIYEGCHIQLTLIDPDDPEGWTSTELDTTRPSPCHAGFPVDVAWTGSALGIAFYYAWSDAPEPGPTAPGTYTYLFLGLYSPSGTAVRSDVEIEDAGLYSPTGHLIWTGSSFTHAWACRQPDFCFVQGIDSFHPIVRHPSGCESYYHSHVPDLAWTGSEYILAWAEAEEPLVGLRSMAFHPGMSLIGELSMPREVDRHPRGVHVQWTGSEMGLAWLESRDDDWSLLFSTTSPETGGLGPVMERPGAFCPDCELGEYGLDEEIALGWTGSEYCISWLGERDGTPSVLFNKIVMCE